ncbi:MAG: TraX protein [Blautia sp.]|nr:TraX protein [Blautia sp.]
MSECNTAGIPDQWKVFDGSGLKLLAVFTMIVDHTASILLWDTYITVFRFGKFTIDLYDMMRLIGRISFPLFAFLLVEGFAHTRNVRRYAGNLLLFALLSEIPWNLAHSGQAMHGSQNVMFTLFLGLLGLWVIRDHQGSLRAKYVLLLALLTLSILLRADYGCSGFGFILMLYLLREQRLYQTIIGCCFLSARWIAGLAFIPIHLYNGRRGFIGSGSLKYVFYLIYPIHLLILYQIRRMTIGY